MSYAGSLSGLSGVQSLAATATAIAAIPLAGAGPDTEVRLYESTYLNQTGRFVLPDSGHGKWVFFSQNGTELYVIAQASSYELDTIDLANPTTCAASFTSSTSVSVAASGALENASINSDTGCAFQATSNVAWIQLISGSYGSGDTTLSYVVRPNTSSQPRTGTITLNSGATITVSQAGSSGLSSGLVNLSVNPVAADYSKALDQLVYVSAAPNELHIYDPNLQSDTFVPLALAPTSVSVDPTGKYAAVGHDGWITYVNLQSMVVQQVFPISTNVSALVLPDNGYVYVFPKQDAFDIFMLNLSNGAVTASLNVDGAQIARADASASTLYIAGSQLSKWDISQGSPIISDSSFPTCGNLWLSEDATRVYTACGTVYGATDFETKGTLSMAGTLQWAADSTQNKSLAVIPLYPPGTNEELIDSQLQVYSNTDLSFVRESALPGFQAGGASYTGHGKYIFWNRAESSVVVVEQADSAAPLLSNYGVYVTSTCSYSVSTGSMTIPATGTTGNTSVAVSADNGCPWVAQSEVPWIQLTGGSGVGLGSFILAVGLNSGAGTRTGTISVAGQTVTISQPPAALAQVAPAALVFSSEETGMPVSTSQTAMFTNTGAVPISFTGIGISGPAASDFAIEGNSCGAVIPGGASCSVAVTFRPTGSGSRTASLSFSDNAYGPVQSVSLMGTGIQYLPVSGNSAGPISRTGDFDGDGKADFVVWRPSEGNWYILPSSGNPKPFWVQQWGLPGDIPLTADFNGDKRSDFVIWRPSDGTWYVLFSNQASSWPPSIVQQWGLPGDIPVPGDYNGDGKADFAVWRPSDGTWYVLFSNQANSWPPSIVQQWGLPGDIPVPGDYDGDGKTDFAVWRPSLAVWYIIPSSDPTHPITQQWGFPTDTPVAADFDGDGKTDMAVWRPSEGTWYIIPSSNPSHPIIQQWGLPGDLPQIGDFSGQGKTSFAIWRPSSASWFVLNPNDVAHYPAPSILEQWGFSDDIPM